MLKLEEKLGITLEDIVNHLRAQRDQMSDVEKAEADRIIEASGPVISDKFVLPLLAKTGPADTAFIVGSAAGLTAIEFLLHQKEKGASGASSA